MTQRRRGVLVKRYQEGNFGKLRSTGLSSQKGGAPGIASRSKATGDNVKRLRISYKLIELAQFAARKHWKDS